MHTFLRNQMEKGLLADYHIYIIEQTDDKRKLNRGKLLNIGFDLARNGSCRALQLKLYAAPNAQL